MGGWLPGHSPSVWLDWFVLQVPWWTELAGGSGLGQRAGTGRWHLADGRSGDPSEAQERLWLVPGRSSPRVVPAVPLWVPEVSVLCPLVSERWASSHPRE